MRGRMALQKHCVRKTFREALGVRARPRAAFVSASFRSSGTGGAPSRACALDRLAVALIDFVEVAAQCFERVFLRVDFLAGAYAGAAQERHGRTPALDSVLEQQLQNNAWKGEDFLG